MSRPILITGAGGQDGWYLGRDCLALGHRVIGLVRPGAEGRVAPGVLALGYDIAGDPEGLSALIAGLLPRRIYHLAAAHHSSEGASAALDATMVAVNHRASLALIRGVLAHVPDCRLIFAGSSQMFTPADPPLVVDETTPARPATFYGVTKAWSREAITWARDRHGLLGGTAILFNHESPRRGPAFVTAKIARAAARGEKLHLFNLGARVDWSAAEDFSRAFIRIADDDVPPGDFVFGSGQLHSVTDFAAAAFAAAGRDWRDHLTADQTQTGPALVANPARLRALGWQPRHGLADLAAMMLG